MKIGYEGVVRDLYILWNSASRLFSGPKLCCLFTELYKETAPKLEPPTGNRRAWSRPPPDLLPQLENFNAKISAAWGTSRAVKAISEGHVGNGQINILDIV